MKFFEDFTLKNTSVVSAIVICVAIAALMVAVMSMAECEARSKEAQYRYMENTSPFSDHNQREE